jgi:hypothetical protein
MQVDPFTDQPYCCPGPNVTVKDVSPKIEHGLLALMLRVKMRRRMFIKEHLYYNAEESRDSGHSKLDTIIQ